MSPEIDGRRLMAAFALAMMAVALCLSVGAAFVGHEGLSQGLLHSAPGLSGVLLCSAILFAAPRSRTYYLLVALSCAASIIVLARLGWQLVARSMPPT
jgi:hypothetical protein